MTARQRSRFWTRVREGAFWECWLWLGTILRHGRSVGVGVVNLNGRVQMAARVAYEDRIGAIPETMSLRRECRNRRCVNPQHAVLQPRGGSLRTRCKNGHSLKETRYQPKGRTAGRCRICANEQAREASTRRRERLAEMPRPEGLCGCGCGTTIYLLDAQQRPRSYARGHQPKNARWSAFGFGSPLREPRQGKAA